MNPVFSKIQTTFLLLVVLVFIQCQKDDVLDIEESATYNVALSTYADEFIQLFEESGTEFFGVFARIINGNISFEKVKLVENRLITEVLENQPDFSTFLLNESGKIQDYVSREDRDSKVTFLSEDFDLAYFDWKTLKLIANNSTKLFFSNAELKYGASIHASQLSKSEAIYSTLKIEGDFDNTKISSENAVSIPMYLMGLPCPPSWKSN